MLRRAEDEIQQRARTDDMEFRHLFAEIAELGQHRGSGLDLVKKEKCPSRDDLHIFLDFDETDDGPNVGLIEKTGFIGIFIEINLHEGVKCLAGEDPHEFGLADLPRAAYDERFSVRRVLPFQKKIKSKAFHGMSVTYLYIIFNKYCYFNRMF